jgi:hypothetical protein
VISHSDTSTADAYDIVPAITVSPFFVFVNVSYSVDGVSGILPTKLTLSQTLTVVYVYQLSILTTPNTPISPSVSTNYSSTQHVVRRIWISPGVSSEFVTLPPVLTQAIGQPSTPGAKRTPTDVQINEEVSLDFTISIPEGTTPALTIVAQLPIFVAPNALGVFLDAKSSVVGSSLSFSQALTISGSSSSTSRRSDAFADLSLINTVTLAFHDVTTTPDGSTTANDSLTVTFKFLIPDNAVAVKKGSLFLF